jgi:hypothetical protein
LGRAYLPSSDEKAVAAALSFDPDKADGVLVLRAFGNDIDLLDDL